MNIEGNLIQLNSSSYSKLQPTNTIRGQIGYGSKNVALRGYSAYEIAVQQGFEGTIQEWLASLQGPQGEQGPRGKGIDSTHLNENGQLVIDYEDGSSYITPSIRGERGPQGPQGRTGDKGSQGESGKKGDPALWIQYYPQYLVFCLDAEGKSKYEQTINFYYIGRSGDAYLSAENISNQYNNGNIIITNKKRDNAVVDNYQTKWGKTVFTLPQGVKPQIQQDFITINFHYYNGYVDRTVERDIPIKFIYDGQRDLPQTPLEDGNYILKAKVVNGQTSLVWELE